MTVQKIFNKIFKEDRRFMMLIFIFSLLLRLVYIFTIAHLPLFDNPTMDAAYHDELAKQIAAGNIIGEGAYIRSPFYAYLLGLAYKIFGANYYIVRIFFALLGGVSVILVFTLARYIFNRRAAVLASVISAASWIFIYYDAELLDTNTALLITLICALVFAKVFDRPRGKGYFFCGLMFGVGALARDNFLPIIGIVSIWLIFYYRKIIKQAVTFSGLFLCGAILVISPVTIRNAVVLGDFIPISCYTGVNLYIGNNPYADGRTAIVPGTRPDWWGGVMDVRSIAENQMQRKLKPSEISMFWAKKAFAYIRSDIFGFFRFSLKKFLFIFDLNETSNNQNIYFFRRQSAMLRLPLFFSSWLYIPLGFLGMFFAIKNRIGSSIPVFVMLAGYCLPLSLFFVYTRMRQPIMGFFTVFSGYALVCLYDLFHTDKINFRNAVLLYLFIFTALALNSSRMATLDDGHFTLGNAYMRKGDYRLARQEFNKAVGLGQPYRSRVFLQLARIEFAESRFEASAKYFLDTIDLDDQLIEQVDDLLTEALFVHPASSENLVLAGEKENFLPFAEIFFLIGNKYASWQKYSLAALIYRKSLALKDDARVNLNLGNVLSITGRGEAAGYYRKALELDKNFVPAYFNLSRELRKENKLKEALLLLKNAANLAQTEEDEELISREIDEIQNTQDTNKDDGSR